MHDLDVRLAVRRHLTDAHAGDPDTLIVEEMGIWGGAVRVDVAVINGEIHGLELKSARDNLDRLPRQAELYNQVFDRVTLVVATGHVTKAAGTIPKWWGLWSATGSVDFGVAVTELRAGVLNPDVHPIQVARLLWRPEALALLDRYNLLRGYRSKPAELLHERLAAELALPILREEVRTVLKSRIGWLRKPIDHQRNVSV